MVFSLKSKKAVETKLPGYTQAGCAQWERQKKKKPYPKVRFKTMSLYRVIKRVLR